MTDLNLSTKHYHTISIYSEHNMIEFLKQYRQFILPVKSRGWTGASGGAGLATLILRMRKVYC